MSKTFLDGKITVTSLATPTDEDMAKINALTPEENQAMIAEALDQATKSGISDRTVDEIFESAVKRAREIQLKQKHAL